MDFGVVFPQTEIGPDPEDAKELIQASEQMGFEGLVVYDHVVGANTDFYKNSGIDFFYDIDSNFHEIFVLLGWAAAITQRIKLITGIVILPQRQTTLVAKQAAAIDVLSGGRLVLGIAVGWNPVEFEALGEDFHNRGKRIDQIVDATWKPKEVAPPIAVPHIGGPLRFWLSAFSSLRPVLADLASQLAGQSLEAVVFPHYLSGPLDARQRLEFLRFHMERHGVQIRRTLQHPDFPGQGLD